MTSLRVIKNRIKTVTNTQKITKSVKLVSVSKYARAEQDLQNARPLGNGLKTFYKEIGVDPPAEINSQLLVALSSDHGLCGGIHSGIANKIHASIDAEPSLSLKTKLICVGDCSTSILSSTNREKLIWTANHIGKKVITFMDAAVIALKINECITEHNFTITKLYYNQFLSGMSYEANVLDLYHKNVVNTGKSLPLYDEIEDEILDSYLEFSYVVIIYWLMKEGACSEFAARIMAMENATRNAAKMVEELNLQFNRSRQSTITQELLEIIAGASAVRK